MCYNMSHSKAFNYFYLVNEKNYIKISKYGKKNALHHYMRKFIINLKP